MHLHDLLLLLQWPGTILGIAGAPLVALKSWRLRYWGFVVWLVSDVCWLAYGVEAHVVGLAITYAIFTVTASVGVWNNRRPHALVP
jgi:hypothetical protein